MPAWSAHVSLANILQGNHTVWHALRLLCLKNECLTQMRYLFWSSASEAACYLHCAVWRSPFTSSVIFSYKTFTMMEKYGSLKFFFLTLQQIFYCLCKCSLLHVQTTTKFISLLNSKYLLEIWKEVGYVYQKIIQHDNREARMFVCSR